MLDPIGGDEKRRELGAVRSEQFASWRVLTSHLILARHHAWQLLTSHLIAAPVMASATVASTAALRHAIAQLGHLRPQKPF